MLKVVECIVYIAIPTKQHTQGLLIVPRHCLSSYGQQAFSVAGPAIWNWLSDSLRDYFKHSLKTFLFSAYSCTKRIRAFWMRSTNLLTYLL